MGVRFIELVTYSLVQYVLVVVLPLHAWLVLLAIASSILPQSIYLLHLSILFSKSLFRISLGPRVWLLVRAAYLVLIDCSLSAFIAHWLRLLGYSLP
jgi:hypothetical protein